MSTARSVRKKFESEHANGHRALAIGFGGAGNDALTHLMDSGCKGIDCLAADTDRYHLHITRAHSKILLQTASLRADDGTRGNVELGAKAAMNALPRIQSALDGVDLVFILAGMGGGTGGGASPVAAKLARERGALVVGLVMKPFFLGNESVSLAVDSLRTLLTTCDTVVLIENYGSGVAPYALPFPLDMDIAGQTACSVVSSITRSFHNPNCLSSHATNLRQMLRHGALAKASVSSWNSFESVEEAALTAIRNIVPHCDLGKADGVFLGISGSLHESELASTLDLVSCRINPDADFLYAHHADHDVMGLTGISLLATGLSFPYTWGGYRRVPTELYEMEPESSYDELLSIKLGIPRLEASLD
jgi:cell division protein FtsZ